MIRNTLPEKKRNILGSTKLQDFRTTQAIPSAETERNLSILDFLRPGQLAQRHSLGVLIGPIMHAFVALTVEIGALLARQQVLPWTKKNGHLDYA